ncbi:hypothetical protein [Mycoplasmopsis sturni]|uniref:hypothetical protein n=1 Tax=Mycoplasmopsis sturni TaxID=39047 RepID=UPI00055A589E|nr:hypothetical protein [Mycoplasmopsis sturni]
MFKIKFQSLVYQNGVDKPIEFTAPVDISSFEEYRVFTFNEPSQGIANRIEISNERINIFAGPTSLYINKDPEQATLNLFELNDGINAKSFEFFSKIHSYTENVDDKNSLYKFKYEIYQKVDGKKIEMGQFEISLTISPE